MAGNQPVQLIRTNIGHSPRAAISQSPRAKIEGSLDSKLRSQLYTTYIVPFVSVSRCKYCNSKYGKYNSKRSTAAVQPKCIQRRRKWYDSFFDRKYIHIRSRKIILSFHTVLLGQSQTYVATIATVLPPRHQTATLVYSNPQQIGTNVSGPRLANQIATQRQGTEY